MREGKTIYVWVEAVMGYVSAAIEYSQRIGKPDLWKEYWLDKDAKTLYFVGKDNIPFHTIILPALLLASGQGYNLPYNVSATEFLQFRGQKASKSQKVGIWIDEALEMFPVDYWRFFLIATRPESKDTNFTWSAFADKINADLNDTFRQLYTPHPLVYQQQIRSNNSRTNQTRRRRPSRTGCS